MFATRLRLAGAVFMVALLCFCLAGCGSKVSKDNYQKIKSGMSEKEVSDILGSPTETKDAGAGKTLIWKSGDDTISVTFMNDKVAVKISSYDLPGK